jgi:hypothetical protein
MPGSVIAEQVESNYCCTVLICFGKAHPFENPLSYIAVRLVILGKPEFLAVTFVWIILCVCGAVAQAMARSDGLDIIFLSSHHR